MRDRPRDHDGSHEIILMWPIFYFLESKYGELLEMESFCLCISIWGSWQTTNFEKKILETVRDALTENFPCKTMGLVFLGVIKRWAWLDVQMTFLFIVAHLIQ